MELKQIVEITKSKDSFIKETVISPLKALSNITSKDKSKYLLNFVYIDAENNVIYATDGRQAIKIVGNYCNIAGTLVDYGKQYNARFCQIDKSYLKFFETELGEGDFPDIDRVLGYFEQENRRPIQIPRGTKQEDGAFYLQAIVAHTGHYINPSFAPSMNCWDFDYINIHNETVLLTDKNEYVKYLVMPYAHEIER